jgi:hypothetical protein
MNSNGVSETTLYMKLRGKAMPEKRTEIRIGTVQRGKEDLGEVEEEDEFWEVRDTWRDLAAGRPVYKMQMCKEKGEDNKSPPSYNSKWKTFRIISKILKFSLQCHIGSRCG